MDCTRLLAPALLLLLGVLVRPSCCAAHNGDDDDRSGVFVLPCAGVMTLTSSRDPGASVRVAYDGLFASATTRNSSSANRAFEHELYRPDVGLFTVTASASGAEHCGEPASQTQFNQGKFEALRRDLRGLERCYARRDMTFIPGNGQRKTKQRAFVIEHCANPQTGRFVRSRVHVVLDTRTKFLRELSVEGGFEYGDGRYDRIDVTPGHNARKEYTLTATSCARGSGLVAKARTLPPRSAFDRRCKVQIVHPAIKFVFLLVVAGAGALVGLLMWSINDRKREAESKKIA